MGRPTEVPVFALTDSSGILFNLLAHVTIIKTFIKLMDYVTSVLLYPILMVLFLLQDAFVQMDLYGLLLLMNALVQQAM
jgi:hypothetical protein